VSSNFKYIDVSLQANQVKSLPCQKFIFQDEICVIYVLYGLDDELPNVYIIFGIAPFGENGRDTEALQLQDVKVLLSALNQTYILLEMI